jgi:DNA-binding winged helix-turn-helix (wHTH) protein
MSQIDRNYDIGKLYFDRGDFHLAIPQLQDAANQYFSKREFSDFLKCQNLLLRMYAEREDHEQIQKTKEILQDLVLREGFELNSKTYYTLAICASYKWQNEIALEYLQKSLSIALATDNKVDMCYAICGLAITYNMLGRHTDALREIYNLQVFFQIIELSDLKMSAQIVNGKILRSLKKFDEALVIFWSCYEVLKSSKSLLHYINLLYELGQTYLELGDKNLARTYLQLAIKSIDPENMRLLYRNTKELLSSFGVTEIKDYDLIFDSEQNTVIEQKIGKVDFKNQFILLDLLKLFLEHPGEVYSKEALVEQIWHQSYDPAVHDNKIYVTIKRLRKLIEPDYEKPKYIFRSKNGYYLNKSAKVLLEQ